MPHEGPMVLLSHVVSHDADETVCAARIDTEGIFVDDRGLVAAWIAIEYMAQAIAVHAGLTLRARGEPPRRGFLLGARRVSLHTPFLAVGQNLEVRARRLWGGTEGLASFDCVLEDGDRCERLAEARLSCILTAPTDSEEHS